MYVPTLVGTVNKKYLCYFSRRPGGVPLQSLFLINSPYFQMGHKMKIIIQFGFSQNLVAKNLKFKK